MHPSKKKFRSLSAKYRFLQSPGHRSELKPFASVKSSPAVAQSTVNSRRSLHSCRLMSPSGACPALCLLEVTVVSHPLPHLSSLSLSFRSPTPHRLPNLFPLHGAYSSQQSCALFGLLVSVCLNKANSLSQWLMGEDFCISYLMLNTSILQLCLRADSSLSISRCRTLAGVAFKSPVHSQKMQAAREGWCPRRCCELRVPGCPWAKRLCTRRLCLV